MAEARQRDEWSRTSSVMALVANTQRNPKKTRPFRPGDFDPFARTADKRAQVIPAPVSVLKDVFIRNQKQQGGTRED
jgi:hypothetical protein